MSKRRPYDNPEAHKWDCPLCTERGKTWDGDDSTCAFPHAHSFNAKNWCCATVGVLRGACEESATYSEDHYVGVVRIPENVGADGELLFTHIVLHWYKRRGATTGAIVFDSEGGTHSLSFHLADAVASSLISAARLERGEA
jgi:hypothetical protein